MKQCHTSASLPIQNKCAHFTLCKTFHIKEEKLPFLQQFTTDIQIMNRVKLMHFKRTKNCVCDI